MYSKDLTNNTNISLGEYLARRDVVLWSAFAFIAGMALDLGTFISSVFFIALSIGLGVCIAGAFFSRKIFVVALVLGFFLFGIVRADGEALTFSFFRHIAPPLEYVRNLFAGGLDTALREPEASYAKGILLGDRQGMSYELRQAFRRTGTSHLTALSGYNVTVIAEYLGSLSRGIALPALGIAFFVIATGAASSLVRAALMGVLVLVVRRAGHHYMAGRALLYAVVAMLFWEPSILFGDIGFQLSVAATAGIIFLVPRFDRIFLFIPKRFGIREALSTTLSAQIATLPFIVFYFGLPSIVSIPANILIIVTMPIAMACAFVAGAVGIFASSVSTFVSLPAMLILWYQLFIVEWFARLY
ncbi:MAG: ComEC/Rec2 family competence protein [Patescibacteria group bacterium]